MKLSPEQLLDFKEAFSLFDHDESGSITWVELGEVLEMLGQPASEQDLKDMVWEIDEDGNGTIEFFEFMLLMTNKMNDMSKEE